MRIVKANHAGACYGVKRALDLANAAAGDGVPVCTLGPLIHNPGVVDALRSRGVSVAESPDEVQEGRVVLRSHGVTPDVSDALANRGLEVIDATCPHVARAQKAAASLARSGCWVIVVGEAGHPEVEGLTAYAAQEGARVTVASDAAGVPPALMAPVGVVVQTTQKAEVLEAVTRAIEAQGIEPLVKNTICSATSLRQEEAAELASAVDAMVVIGGRNSSNTTRLAELCRARGARTFHIEDAAELEGEWFDGVGAVGVTAGASTPQSQIDEVVARLDALAAPAGRSPAEQG